MKIYIVFGECGEYEDFTSWVVRAFKSKKKAEEFILKAKKEINVLYEKTKHMTNSPNIFSKPRPRTECDPAPHFDYTGTGYRYEETELDESN